MKRIIVLLIVALFVLTSCVAAVVEGEVEEKVDVIENSQADEENLMVTPDENEIPAVSMTGENESAENPEIPLDENEIPAVSMTDENETVAPTPDENELEAIPVDFDNITEEELTDLLESFVGQGQKIEFPILPIEPKN